MIDTSDAPGAEATTAPAGLSSVSRLLEAALRIASDCPCEGSAGTQIRVLRGFDRQSREHAKTICSRLRKRDSVEPLDEPVPVVAVDAADHEHHVCVYVDASDRPTEAQQIAAVRHVPLVAPARPGAGGATRGRGGEHVAVLMARLEARKGAEVRTFPSAAGCVPEIAFESFEVLPNQPETGHLTLSLGDGLPRHLDQGSRIRMTSLPTAMLVEASDAHGGLRSWLADIVTIRQIADLHSIYRDGRCIADLDLSVQVRHDGRGLRRHLV